MAPQASPKNRATSEQAVEENESTSNSPQPEQSAGSSSKSPVSDSESKEDETTESATASGTAESASQWQAVWAPQYNAYYFFNPTTQETTWTNPLQPEASTSTSTSASAEPEASVSASVSASDDNNPEASSSTGPTMSAASAKYAALQAAALAQGIDPALAHLDPTLLASVPGGSKIPGDVPTFTAKFNAHTGKFAPDSARTSGHMSEYERAKRMSEFYFDVNKWEEDLAKRGGSIRAEEGDDEEGGSGKKRKRPSKKDLERFKEQKKQKKIAKTAWLRT